MPKFLIEASYTIDGVKGVRSGGGTSSNSTSSAIRSRSRRATSHSPLPSAIGSAGSSAGCRSTSAR